MEQGPHVPCGGWRAGTPAAGHLTNRRAIISAIHIHPDTKHRLAELAQTTGKTPADIVQEALDSYLDDLEDIALAEQRLEDLKAGRSRTYTLEEVERDLGLDD